MNDSLTKSNDDDDNISCALNLISKRLAAGHKNQHINLTGLTFNKPSLFLESELEIKSPGCSWHTVHKRNLTMTAFHFCPIAFILLIGTFKCT